MRTEYLEVLELLPVWQLRKPLPSSQEAVQDAPPVVTPVAQISEEAVSQTSSNVLMFADETSDLQLMHLADGVTNAAQQLLNNIANSMQLKGQPTSGKSLTEALQQPTKVLLVLGETLANELMSSQQGLQQLRGKQHTIEDRQVVVSYDLEAMLNQPAIKAQVWQDCCFAMSLLEDKQD